MQTDSTDTDDARTDLPRDPIQEIANDTALAVTPSRDADGPLDFDDYCRAVEETSEWIEATIRAEVDA